MSKQQNPTGPRPQVPPSRPTPTPPPSPRPGPERGSEQKGMPRPPKR